MNIGITIKTVRTIKGYSQTDLKNKTGLSSTSLSKIEKGHKVPHLKNLNIICEALDFPIAGIYALSISEDDMPESKRDKFKQFNELARQIFS